MACMIDKCGYMGVDTKIAIELKYKNASSFADGRALMPMGEILAIDKNGAVVGKIVSVYDIGIYNEGLTGVGKNDKWGFIDKNGKVVVPLQYDGARDFSEGVAWVQIFDKWIMIDKNGKFL
ncbi:hypothetical protein LMG8286_01642 [Campylobacter suis]|uniref:WG repeat-containing protein n=1 Tax=Campylobacter suis TaxID=2790657 RepID=A0ABM8Q8F3_9BACT|nr:hypothetical protein LMG8286_01642 [Campylobacter suis]